METRLTLCCCRADFRKSKGSDIIQLLVSIYDSKDVFIKELQVLLAQRLLAIKDYALEKEVSSQRPPGGHLCSLVAYSAPL